MKRITKQEESYSKLLKQIENAPEQLYIEGNESLLQQDSIAIIGSRHCSESGKIVAYEFSKQLSQMGICIVSGMALGIDTWAHLGALENGGKTIAVLGCGFKHIYPKENKELFYRIIETGGLILTEYKEEEEACSQKFIARNRIVSGLSMGTLVIEAAYRSGTSVTASLAKKQGRKVFCIPHDINDKHGIGTNALLTKDAICVTNPQQIMRKLGITYNKKDTTRKAQKEIIAKRDFENPEYLAIDQILQGETMHITQIARKLKKDIHQLNATLTMMELEGYITQLPGKKFCMTQRW